MYSSSDEDPLESLFTQAAGHLPVIMDKSNPADLLYLYARYKQANEGQCNTPKPGFFDFQGKQKWEAWKCVGELSQQDAMMQYIEKINTLDPDWRDSIVKTKPADSWTSVSTMLPEDEMQLPDEQKTVYDWCKEGNLDRMRDLLADTDVNAQDEEGMSLLHWSCDRGNEAMVDFLLQNNAYINCIDDTGQTPLHYASSCGHGDLVKLLLNNNADHTIADFDGGTAETVAADDSTKDIFKSWAYWGMSK